MKTATLCCLNLVLASSLAVFSVHAAKDNGSACTFPFHGCYTATLPDSLHIEVKEKSQLKYVFTVSSKSDRPLPRNCVQDLNKITIKTTAACNWSKVSAFYTIGNVTTKINSPTIDMSGRKEACSPIDASMLKLNYLKLNYTMIKANNVTFTIKVDPTPGPFRCTSIDQLINNEDLFYRTATNLVKPALPMSLFSTDFLCCAMTAPASAP